MLWLAAEKCIHIHNPAPPPTHTPGSESLDEVVARSLPTLSGPLLKKVSLQSKL